MFNRFRPSFLAVTLLLCAAFFASHGRPRPAPAYAWFPFNWYGQTIGSRYYDKLAIIVPVKINDLKANFVTQFDLGSDATLLYENAIKNYFASRAQLYALVDTTHRGVADNGSINYRTKGLPFTLGALVIPCPLLMAKHGDAVPPDSLHTSSEKLVGTIGSDFLKDKVLVIDYPRRRMCVLDSVDAYWRARTVFVAARVKNNRFQLPITVNKRTYWTLFDTGASLFPLNTDYATWQRLMGQAAITDSMQVSSWGTLVPHYGATMPHDAYLGKLKLPKSKAWFNRNKRLADFNRQENIDALTGNAFFLNNVVVLDYQHHKFGVVK